MSLVAREKQIVLHCVLESKNAYVGLCDNTKYIIAAINNNLKL